MATAETEPRDDQLGRLLSTHPVAGWRYLRTGAVALACFAVPLVLMYRYMISTGADDIGGGTTVALAPGMRICVIGLVMSLVVFIMMLIASLRTRGDGRTR